MRGLYAIIDPDRCGEHDPLSLARAVLAGGCCALQLRDKRCSDADYIERARPMMAACRAASVPFVVNDRVDVAAQLRPDGLHLGQEDAPIAEARQRIAGIDIGISTHDLAQVDAAIAAGADLIGFGPVFGTVSKDDPDTTVGAELLAQACRRATIPVVAIGGITPDNLPQVIAANAHLAAVISALATSPNPKTTAQKLHTALQR